MAMTKTEIYAAIALDQKWLQDTVGITGTRTVGDYIVAMRRFIREAEQVYIDRTLLPDKMSTTSMRRVVALGMSCLETNGVP